MNDHPLDLLPRIAEGAVPSPPAAAHLERCERCRAALEALVPVDLATVWDGVVSELAAPRPRLLERLALRVGLDPSLARVAAVTPSLSAAWVVATVAVAALGLALAALATRNAAAPALIVAPLVAAAAVAFAYGPGVDPAYEVVAITPLSPVRVLLARLAAVLVVDATVVGVLDLALGGGALGLAWLLPMTAVALLAACVASRFVPIVGAATGMAAWVLVLGVLHAETVRPLAVLAGPAGQSVSASAVLCLVALLARRTARSAWSLPPA